MSPKESEARTESPNDPCDSWRKEGRNICHRSYTEDGKFYSCAECGIRLSGPNEARTSEATK